MTGRLIVFEGIDHSGKETQARLLTNYLRDNHKTVATFSFPNYQSWSGQRIQQWLQKRLELNQYEVNTLYSLNRFEMKDTLEQCLIDYDYVILDRYYYSNWVYGSFMEEMPGEWLEVLDKPLPRPDVVILLCISGALSAQRGDSGDIHEANTEFLDKCNHEYQRIGYDLGWIMIDGDDAPEKIHYNICTSFDSQLIVK